jgi:copper resistance protein D
LDDSLILVRAVHFASTVLVSGVVFFLVFIAEPAFRKTGGNGSTPAALRSQLGWLAGIGLVVVVISGAAWLLLLTARMVDLPLVEALSARVVWTVMTQTDFGHDWMARAVISGLLAATLLPLKFRPLMESCWREPVAVSLASALVGTLAWAGHAAANSGVEGNVHLLADVLHLIAAAAWIGALVPLALLLRVVRGDQHETSVAIGRDAVLRFSTLGIVSVGTLTATGVVNGWMLVGSVTALTDTDYGRLLMVKIGLFFVMLSIAAVNRFRLTPRLTQKPSATSSHEALRQIERNSLIEASVGAIIIGIVAVLGTLPPGAEQAAN